MGEGLLATTTAGDQRAQAHESEAAGGRDRERVDRERGRNRGLLACGQREVPLECRGDVAGRGTAGAIQFGRAAVEAGVAQLAAGVGFAARGIEALVPAGDASVRELVGLLGRVVGLGVAGGEAEQIEVDQVENLQ